ncbi:MAG: kinase [Candidatus Atribacteria bacterium]|nr:kinase [Candidatus Atribacteria bacterium]
MGGWNLNGTDEIHIFVKKESPEVLKEARKLQSFLASRGHRALILDSATNLVGKPALVFVLGGDGTFLNAARWYAPSGVPLLGIDMGGLGFLASVSVDNMLDAALAVLEGRFRQSKRMMLDCFVHYRGGKVQQDIALNDVVIYRGAFAQMIRLSTYVDSDFLASFPADGLIVATPTGSSAYSLSAGGPVVYPELELLIITPICAHTLYARSVVTAPSSTVKVVLESEKEGTMVTLDGQRGYALHQGEFIVVKKSNVELLVLHPFDEQPFYSLLRRKLSWGMDIRKRVDGEC